MNRRLSIVLLMVGALLVFASVSSAAPGAPGTPTLRWVTTSTTTAEIRADGIANGGGQPNNGAISWDIYFRFPNSVSAPYPTITAVAGSAWTALNCAFNAAIDPDEPSGPGLTGDRGVFLNGSCTSGGTPASSVIGDNVLLATLTFNNCPSVTGGFVMDLDSGDDVYGVPVADMFDRSNDAYTFTDASLTDGAPICASPTAVTLANFTAVAQPDHVLVTWETVSEVNNAGFNLYRDTSPTGPGVQINSALIASQGPGSTGGFSYNYQDFDAPHGVPLYYWLEAVDLNGNTSRYGPVSVEPAAPTAVGLDSFAAQPTAAGWPLWPAALVALAGAALTVRRLRRGRRAERLR